MLTHVSTKNYVNFTFLSFLYAYEFMYLSIYNCCFSGFSNFTRLRFVKVVFLQLFLGPDTPTLLDILSMYLEVQQDVKFTLIEDVVYEKPSASVKSETSSPNKSFSTEEGSNRKNGDLILKQRKNGENQIKNVKSPLRSNKTQVESNKSQLDESQFDISRSLLDKSPFKNRKKLLENDKKLEKDKKENNKKLENDKKLEKDKVENDQNLENDKLEEDKKVEKDKLENCKSQVEHKKQLESKKAINETKLDNSKRKPHANELEDPIKEEITSPQNSTHSEKNFSKEEKRFSSEKPDGSFTNTKLENDSPEGEINKKKRKRNSLFSDSDSSYKLITRRNIEENMNGTADASISYGSNESKVSLKSEANSLFNDCSLDDVWETVSTNVRKKKRKLCLEECSLDATEMEEVLEDCLETKVWKVKKKKKKNTQIDEEKWLDNFM